MAPAAGVSDRLPAAMMMPATVMSDAYAKDAIISWFRGEFAAANAIIDALCGHLSETESGRREYKAVFGEIHRRRMNWIPILQMQKYFSIADVTMELKKVSEAKKKSSSKIICDDNVSKPGVIEPPAIDHMKQSAVDSNGDGNCCVDDNISPKSTGIITDDAAGSQEVHSAVESVEISSNQEDWEARRAEIKMTKGFVAKESVKGHMVNVVRGLKMYEEILQTTELSKLTDYVTELRVAGQNGELSGGSCDS